MKSLLSVGMTTSVLACAFTTFAAEPLVVTRAGKTESAEKLEYDGITLHGDYTIGAGTSVTNVGTFLEIGPDAGDNPVMTVRDGGQYVGSGTSQDSKKVIRFGQNGGAGKIVVSDVEKPSDTKRNKSGWNYNNYTFGAMEWNLMLPEGASTASDTMDIVQIDTNAFFSIWNVSNRNTQVKARILFNGGTYYQHHRCSIPFNPILGSEIILEGINGNDINIMRMDGQLRNLVGYEKTSGLLRFRGDCDVVLNGTGDKEGSSLRPGIRLSPCVRFEQTGDLIIKSNLLLTLDGTVPLPCGPGTGDIVLQDAGTTFDLVGQTICVNGLQGVGSITNSSTTAIAVLTVTNANDRLSSELISPSLVWKESPKGYECVKMGLGAMLADSLPPTPLLTIAEGSVHTTADATPETMKGKTVDFKQMTSLDVETGTFSSEKAVYHPLSTVTVAAGGTYRANGESYLMSPAVAAGGAIEKAGDGTLTIYDSETAYPGVLRVLGGTVRLSARGDTNDFWRLTVRQSGSGTSQYLKQLSGINLFRVSDIGHDFDATRAKPIGMGDTWKQVEPGTVATALKANEIAAGAQTFVTNGGSTAFTSDLKYLMTYDRWSYVTFVNEDGSNRVVTESDENSWVTVTFRFKAGHDPADNFRLLCGWGGSACPQVWTLESSPDGTDGSWETRAERTGGRQITYVNSNDQAHGVREGTLCHDFLTGYSRFGSAGLAATSVLRADAGATIDLGCVPEGQAPCGGLEVDCARGGGTISRFEPVEGGVLRITNFPQGQRLAGFELPLSFGSVVNAANLSSWTVFVNGVDKGARGIEFRDGKAYVGGKGLLLIVR